MLLKDYVEGSTKLLNDDPEYGELEVWTYSDDEGNSILPMYEGSVSAFVEKDVHRETDEYVPSYYLKEYPDDCEISVGVFLETLLQKLFYFKGDTMIDNTDLNNLLIEAILITTDEQANFVSKKLQEDAVHSDKMKEALSIYEKLTAKEKQID